MGEPFARLPHSVPEWRIGGEPKRSAISASIGIARHDRGVGIRQRDCRADFERVAACADLLQLLHFSDIKQGRQIAQLLGHPEPDVRAAREQQRVAARAS